MSNTKVFPLVKGLFIMLTFLVRWPVFLAMCWLRPPIVFVCNLVSIVGLMAWLFSWYAFPEKPEMVWGICIASFGAFFIAWAYDFILMAISPEDMMF